MVDNDFEVGSRQKIILERLSGLADMTVEGHAALVSAHSVTSAPKSLFS